MTTRESYQKELMFVIAQCWMDGQEHSETCDDGTIVCARRRRLNVVAWMALTPDGKEKTGTCNLESDEQVE